MTYHIPHSKPSLGEAEKKAVSAVLETGMLSQGREVEAFEADCAAVVGRRHAVAVSSGTAALHLALVCLGVKRESPVAVPAYACAALLQPILWQCGTPVLFDTGPDYQPLLSEEWPLPPLAVVPHLFGAPMRLPEGPTLIEDIAQSIGGPTGKAGQVTVASFYATKLLTTGEGGMLLCDDEGLAEEARDRREYDNRDELRVRYAYKMTDFQAALGRVQLQRLPDFIAQRRAIAAHYNESFASLPLILPKAAQHVYFRYVVRTPRQAALAAFLEERGVIAKRPVYRPLSHYLGGDFPGAEDSHHDLSHCHYTPQ